MNRYSVCGFLLLGAGLALGLLLYREFGHLFAGGDIVKGISEALAAMDPPDYPKLYACPLLGIAGLLMLGKGISEKRRSRT